MNRPLMRVLPAALVAVIAIAPSSAHAASPLIFHESFADSVQDVDLCGITVDLTERGVFTDKVFLDAQGNFVRFMSSLSVKTTFTAENGKSIVIQAAQNFIDPGPAIDVAAGTITFTSTFKGLPEKISTQNGPVVLRDAGVISFSDTFDLETGDFISSDVIIQGPHPDAESDFALFCQVIAAALT